MASTCCTLPFAFSNRPQSKRVKRVFTARGASNNYLSCIPELESDVGQQLMRFVEAGDLHRIEHAAGAFLVSLRRSASTSDVSSRSTATPDEGDSGLDMNVLQQRIQELQQQRSTRALAEVLAALVAARIRYANVMLVQRLDDIISTDVAALNERQDLLGSLPGLALALPSIADGILGYVHSALGVQPEPKADTVLSMDRMQGAQLYMGTLEFGYFLRGLAERFSDDAATNATCDGMVARASQLAASEIRRLSQVKTVEGWLVGIERSGSLFELPRQKLEGNVSSYPQLSKSVFGGVIAPPSRLPEYYSPPGSADAVKDSAASRAARGWTKSAEDDLEQLQGQLPEPDLVGMLYGHLTLLLQEAALLGCLLWEAETWAQQNKAPLAYRDLQE